MKVLTENKEELAIKDLIESDIDDLPAFRERDNKEEVSIEDIDAEDIGETVFEGTEEVDLDDFEFNAKDMFEDEDDEIDTTIPDASDLDDLDDLDDIEVFDEE